MTQRDIVMAVSLLAAAIVPGCGMFDQKVVYKPYEKQVPIEVPCVVDKVDEPDWATKSMPHVDPSGTNIDVAVDKLAAERHQHVQYEQKLKAASDACR
jgi:hypothetical protein